jgi:hypothetical protein
VLLLGHYLVLHGLEKGKPVSASKCLVTASKR